MGRRRLLPFQQAQLERDVDKMPLVRNSPPAVTPSALPPPVAVRPSTPKKVAGHTEKQRAVHKGDRHSKEKGRYDNRIDMDVLKSLKKFCTDHDMEQQTFAQISAVHYMEYVAGHKEREVDGLPSHDDLKILYKTDEDIIALYRQYLPLNKWKAGDDREGRKMNDVDRRLIEYGILQCLFRKGKGKINSFKYFVEEIRILEDLHLPDQALSAAVFTLRRRWKKFQEDGSERPQLSR